MKTRTPKRYRAKQHRMTGHVEKTYEKKGIPRAKTWSIAWSTIRKFLGEGPDSKRICRIFL